MLTASWTDRFLLRRLSRQFSSTPRKTAPKKQTKWETQQEFLNKIDEKSSPLQYNSKKSHWIEQIKEKADPLRLPTPPEFEKETPSAAAADTNYIHNTFYKYQFTPALMQAIHQSGLSTPTLIQELAIPKITSQKSCLIVGQTGTGKTMAYLLPMLDQLMRANREQLYPLPGGRVRSLIIVPTRELANQIHQILRKFPISSAAVSAGTSLRQEIISLQRGVDVLVGTPAKLLTHLSANRLTTTSLRFFVMEESSLLVSPAYSAEVRKLLAVIEGWDVESACRLVEREANTAEDEKKWLEEVLAKEERRGEERRGEEGRGDEGRREERKGDKGKGDKSRNAKVEIEERKGEIEERVRQIRQREQELLEKRLAYNTQWGRSPPSLILVSAVKTEALTEFIHQHISRSAPISPSLLSSPPPSSTSSTSLLSRKWEISQIISPDAHSTSSTLQQVFIPLQGQTRATRLLETLQEENVRNKKTIVFANSVDACKRVQSLLKETGYNSIAVHNLMSAATRASNFDKFRQGKHQILVSTGIVSYGLDLPNVRHVVLYDFPYSVADYLQRSGRTGRGGEIGRVSTLVANSHLGFIKKIQDASKTNAPLEIRGVGRGVRKIMKLEHQKRILWERRYKNRIKYTRRRLGLGPRNMGSAYSRYFAKRSHWENKAKEKRDFLIRRGRLGKDQKLPRRANAAVEHMDTQEFNSVVRNADGLLQIIPKRRSRLSHKKTHQKKTQYDPDAVPI